jgi:hypothetical protein
MNHAGHFSLLTTGTLATAGLVDDFGGATLATGVGVAASWARLGSVEVIASEEGRIEHSLAAGELPFSLSGVGNVDWSRVDLDSIALDVILPSWHNPRLACDVNDDGFCEPLDALFVIGDLNTRGVRQLPDLSDGAAPPLYLDTTGDGFLTANDVVRIVNEINSAPQAGDAEGEWNRARIAADTLFRSAPGFWAREASDELTIARAVCPGSPPGPELAGRIADRPLPRATADERISLHLLEGFGSRSGSGEMGEALDQIVPDILQSGSSESG